MNQCCYKSEWTKHTEKALPHVGYRNQHWFIYYHIMYSYFEIAFIFIFEGFLLLYFCHCVSVFLYSLHIFLFSFNIVLFLFCFFVILVLQFKLISNVQLLLLICLGFLGLGFSSNIFILFYVYFITGKWSINDDVYLICDFRQAEQIRSFFSHCWLGHLFSFLKNLN